MLDWETVVGNPAATHGPHVIAPERKHHPTVLRNSDTVGPTQSNGPRGKALTCQRKE
jgi:hypothetical protein